MLLGTPQYTGQPPWRRVTEPRMSVMPRLQNPGLLGETKESTGIKPDLLWVPGGIRKQRLGG